MHAGADVVEAGVDGLLQQAIHIHARGSGSRTPDGLGARLVVADLDLDEQRRAPGDGSVGIEHVPPPWVAGGKGWKMNRGDAGDQTH